MGKQVSGGAHTSRTMLLNDLMSVLAACPAHASIGDYRTAIVEQNVAGKDTQSSRQRTFRYLRELYRLDLDDALFRGFLRLWARDPQGRPQIAMLMAVTNDKALAATSPGVLSAAPGSPVTSEQLAAAVDREFPGSYVEAIRAKIGRNALSSWTQAGYLQRSGPRSPALRQSVDPSPGAVAMALLLGEADGMSGERLFNSRYTVLLDASSATLHDRAHEAARKGWLGYQSRGAVTEVDLDALVAAPDDRRLPAMSGACA